MMRPKDHDSTTVEWFEALVYLGTSIAIVWLSVEEWRVRRAIEQAKDILGLGPERPTLALPTAAEISAVHARAREILDHPED